MTSRYDTIWGRIKANMFKNILPYPTNEVLDKHEKYQNLTKEINQLQAGVQKLESDRSILVSDMKRAYANKSRELWTEFREALEKAYQMQNHPKKDRIWEKAWDDGHRGGYTEILNAYDELVELLS